MIRRQTVVAAAALICGGLGFSDALQVRSFIFEGCTGPGVDRKPWAYIDPFLRQTCILSARTDSAAARLTEVTLVYDVIQRIGGRERLVNSLWKDIWKASGPPSGLQVKRHGGALLLLIDPPGRLADHEGLHSVVIHAQLKFSDGTVYRKALSVAVGN